MFITKKSHMVGTGGVDGDEDDVRSFCPGCCTNQKPEQKCLYETLHGETKREFTRGKLP